jgi:hypothetical protein
MFDLSALRSYHDVNAEAISDTDLTDLEARVVGFLQKKVGWYLGAPKEQIWYINGSNIEAVWLPQGVKSIDKIEISRNAYRSASQLSTLGWYGGEALIAGSIAGQISFTEIDSDSYFVEDERRLVLISGVWGASDRIRVTATIGYDAGEEPEDLKLLANEIIGYLLSIRGSQGMKGRKDDHSLISFQDSFSKAIPLYDEVISGYLDV